ncbi:hypothetical protein HHK36_011334 [Tetracentron sinense]|uniref:Uncharacterized protein n=1 Tax=Tetracentron sinense TaxID=13715 RepID=A0A835DG38_TETSI|nr:hypothetical protein HHK36_011334 [Tetracentron sinense]
MDCEDAYSAAASSSSSSSSTSNLHSPHVPLEVHVQTSTHKKKAALAWDIQSAALEAAEAFRPPATSSSPTSLSPSEWLRVKSPEKVTEPMSSSFFFDEEALFNMPGLLDSMAEGLLLTPPAMHKGFYWDDLDHEIDLTLWRA